MPNELERARAARRAPTAAERKLWAALRRDALGWHFRRQHAIPPYTVDSACVVARVVIEADGGQHAEPGEHAARDAALSRQGWHILRFWNNEITENLPGVLAKIKEACDGAGAPSLTLPRKRERESPGKAARPI